MQISQLIEHLENFKNIHGDTEVLFSIIDMVDGIHSEDELELHRNLDPCKEQYVDPANPRCVCTIQLKLEDY